METKWFWLIALLAVSAVAVTLACGDDDDDDDDDDSGTDDDDASDDDADDDDNGDDDTEPPYDAAACGDFIDAWYGDCHLEIGFDGAALSEAEALASCKNYEYNFWLCALDCFEDTAAECVELWGCVQDNCVES